ncbi:hypothetical protein CC86DRAFT_377551 [Ophiobolus disseminans]|uniref:Uncharacterized protein n=1 Tax=Ophiobolus disseminans TaxID=1469910 RepID=A0A6A7AGL4_9PLEO|nr:hypothetical protein CC86DRAFT_377551 [Ophiobolus disseminans]
MCHRHRHLAKCNSTSKPFAMNTQAQPPKGTALSAEDIKALEHLLEHKLHEVPPLNKSHMYTIVEITNGTQDQYRPYLIDDVDEGATFRGYLHQRGLIMRNNQLGLRLVQWDLQTIIAMFCSNVDKHRSFDTRRPRQQMRNRFASHIHPRKPRIRPSRHPHRRPRPTHHTRRFAQLLAQNESLFDTQNTTKTKLARCRKTITRLNAMRQTEHAQWALIDPTIKATLTYICPMGISVHAAPAEKARGKRKTIELEPAKDEGGDYGYGYNVASSTPFSPAFTSPTTPALTILCDRARIEAHLPQNPLLTALVQPVLGALFKDDRMEFTWQDVAKYSKTNIHVSGALPDSYKIMVINEEEDEEKGDLVRFVRAGDVGRMVEFRDRGYDEAGDEDV